MECLERRERGFEMKQRGSREIVSLLRGAFDRQKEYADSTLWTRGTVLHHPMMSSMSTKHPRT